MEETLNELQEAADLGCSLRAKRGRQGYCGGHYETAAGNVTLCVPRLKGVHLETVIIERNRHWESRVEETLIEMYLAGVSVRRVLDIAEAL